MTTVKNTEVLYQNYNSVAPLGLICMNGTQELGAASGKTWDELTRDELMTNTNVLLADAYDDTGYKSTPSSRAELKTASVTNKLRCRLTPDMIAKAVRQLRNTNTPYFEGKKYVAVVHPSTAYDLMRHPEWNDYHKYSATAGWANCTACASCPPRWPRHGRWRPRTASFSTPRWCLARTRSARSTPRARAWR